MDSENRRSSEPALDAADSSLSARSASAGIMKLKLKPLSSGTTRRGRSGGRQSYSSSIGFCRRRADGDRLPAGRSRVHDVAECVIRTHHAREVPERLA